MKVLVATPTGQGRRESDFCWTVDGELVVVPFQCDADGDDPDGGCGCRRAMAGLSSNKGTTTFMVVESPMTHDDYVYAIHDANERAGWGDHLDFADNMAALLLEVAAEYPPGTILERRGENFERRL